MTEEEKNSVNEALNQVNKTRRGFLKALLIGSAALAAAPLLVTTALAQGEGGGEGGGREGGGEGGGGGCPGKGKGKGKGKGGKGKGKGGGGGGGGPEGPGGEDGNYQPD